MSEERIDEATQAVAAGRIEELRRLAAAERALADALTTYARSREGGSELLHFAEHHVRHARLLLERIRELGGSSDIEPDDIWISGNPRDLDVIVNAERAAHRTFHDHIIDLDELTRRLVCERILPDHEQILEVLTGERRGELEYG